MFQLYGEFADVFDLSESKLAIIHCAGHYDPTLVESMWKDIIEKGNLGGHKECLWDIPRFGRMSGTEMIFIRLCSFFFAELESTATAPLQTRMNTLGNKLIALGRMYGGTERYFPLRKLSQKNQLHIKYAQVHMVIRKSTLCEEKLMLHVNLAI